MKTLSLAIVLLGVACAPAATTSSARITAAEVPAETATQAEAQAKPTAAREAASQVQALEAPPGRLACRANSPADGTIELYVDGQNGTLRRTAPSGMVETTKVRVENVREMLVADVTGSTDLAVHAAMVHAHQGKHYLRLGDWNQTWAPCE